MKDNSPYVATPSSEDIEDEKRANYSRASINFKEERKTYLPPECKSNWQTYYEQAQEVFPITEDNPITRAFRQGFAWGRIYNQSNIYIHE